jgi:hypothetical protein
MKSKHLAFLVSCAFSLTQQISAQGFIGNGTATGIQAVNSGGTVSNVNVGIGTPPTTSTLEVYAPSNLNLKFDNLPSLTTPSVLYYDNSTGAVTYGAAASGSGITSVDYDPGIGTVIITPTVGAPIPSTNRAWLLTGSTTTPSSYFGTFNDDDIRIATNNANTNFDATRQKMVITAGTNPGNVGIGMFDGLTLPTAPLNKLLVQNSKILNPYPLISPYGITPDMVGILATSNYPGSNIAIGTVVSQDNSGNNVGFGAFVTGNDSYNNGLGMILDGNGGINSQLLGINANIGLNSLRVGYCRGMSATIGGSSTENTGVIGEITTASLTPGPNPGSNAGSTCTGIYGVIRSGADGSANFGVEGDLSNVTTPAPGATYYAIYGIAPAGASAASAPTGPVSPGNVYAGFFDGDVFCANTYYYSDPKLKENITEYNGALDQLRKLPVKNYTFRQSEFPTMNFPQGEQIGMLSTDLKKVFPNLIKQSTQPAVKGKGGPVTYDAVNYNALIPVLVEAVHELDTKTSTIASQQAQISDLSKQLTDLKNLVSDICNGGCASLQGNTGAAAVGGGNIVLNQSIPNPSSGSVVISYAINIPFSTASIHISDKGGKLIRQYSLPQQQGAASITFDGQSVAGGTYLYSITVDSKVYDTKSMVIVKE